MSLEESKGRFKFCKNSAEPKTELQIHGTKPAVAKCDYKKQGQVV